MRWSWILYTHIYFYIQLNGSNYCKVIHVIRFCHTVKRFQELLFNTDYLIQPYSFVCIKLNSFKYRYVTQYNLKSFFFFACTQLNGQIVLFEADRTLSDSITPDQSGTERNDNEGVLHIPKFFRCSSASYLQDTGILEADPVKKLQ